MNTLTPSQIPARTIRHLLDPLVAPELRVAVDTLRAARGLGERDRFVIVRLNEPAKDLVRSFVEGKPIVREAFAVVFDADSGRTYEGIVDLVAAKVRSWSEVEGIQPQVMLDEFTGAIDVVRAHPGFQAALRKRGIDDPGLVHIEAWSIGDLAPPELTGRRVVWTPCWVKSDPPTTITLTRSGGCMRSSTCRR